MAKTSVITHEPMHNVLPCKPGEIHWIQFFELNVAGAADHCPCDIGNKNVARIRHIGYSRRFVDDDTKEIAPGSHDIAGVNADPHPKTGFLGCIGDSILHCHGC